MADWPRDDRPGNHPPPRPRRTLLDNWSSSWAPGGWARLMAGSGRVSGAMVHVSKRDRGGVASVDRTLSTGDQRPAVVRGRTISRHRRRSAHSRVSLTCLLKSHCVFVLRTTFVKFTTETCCSRSLTITCDTAVDCRSSEVGL